MTQKTVFASLLIALLTTALLLTSLTSIATTSATVTFTPTGQFLGNGATVDLAVGDLDGDMDLDVFAANNLPNRVWFNNGNGTFSNTAAIGSSFSRGVSLGDLDGDSDLDAAVADPGGGTIWLNDGSAVFTTTGLLLGGGVDDAWQVALGDLDGDMDLDAFVANHGANTVWLNDGAALFADTLQTLGTLDSNDVVLGDVDGDMDLDAVVANGSATVPNQPSKLYLNDGSGGFVDTQDLAADRNIDAELADLDGDGDLDALFSGDAGPGTIWLNQGGAQGGTQGQFVNSGTFSSQGGWRMAVADVDQDMDLDVAIANSFGSQLLLNDGGGNLSIAQIEFNDLANAAVLADFDGDNDPDLMLGLTGPNVVWRNDTVPQPPPPSPTPPTPMPANAVAWHNSIVDEDIVTGHGIDMALDWQDRPHLSMGLFYPGDGVVYAQWDGVRWWAETVAIGFRPGNETAVALNSDSLPGIGYVNRDLSDVHYVVTDGSGSWTTELVEDVDNMVTISEMALAYDSADRPHMAYFTESELHVASRTSPGSWTIEQLLVNGAGDTGLSKLIIDANDERHLAYGQFIVGKSTGWQLVYNHWDGAAWQTQVVITDTVRFDTVDLALDSSGRPRIAYSLADTLYQAAWDGAAWQIDPISTLNSPLDVELLLDSGDASHILVSNFVDTDTSDLHLFGWDAGGWLTTTLPIGDRPEDLVAAFDSQGNLHAAVREAEQNDTHVLFHGPAWTTVPVDANQNVANPVVDVAVNDPILSYHAAHSNELRLLERQPDQWQARPFASVTLSGAESSIHYNPPGLNVVESYDVSYYDSDDEALIFAEISDSGVVTEVVEAGSDVGQFNVLMPHQFYPSIAYWDGSSYQLKLALKRITAWEVFTSTVSPALFIDAIDAARSGTGNPSTMWVTYHDSGNDTLRLASWEFASGSWTRDIPVTTGAGLLHSLEIDTSNGNILIAYYDPGDQTIKLETYGGGNWQTEIVAAGLPLVTSLHLELGLGEAARPRIAYTTFQQTELYFAYKLDGVWAIETVGTPGGAFSLSEASLVLGERPFIAYIHSQQGLQLAIRRDPLDRVESVPFVPPSPGTDIDDDDGDDINWCDPFTFAPRGPDHVLAPVALSSGHDFLVFDRLTDLFYASSGGQHYVDLYLLHAAEMGRIALADPELLWDSYRTLRGFMPGLDALTTGQGDSLIVTQELVDNGLDIWSRIAAVASPALAQVINQELAASNNLQDFVGLTFAQWAAALGVQAGGTHTMYLPTVRSP